MIFILVLNCQNLKIEIINLTNLYTNANNIFYNHIKEQGIFEDYSMVYVGF